MNKRLRDESGQQAVSGARDALARAVGDSVGSPPPARRAWMNCAGGCAACGVLRLIRHHYRRS
jgi:hypothetical protein